MQEQSDDSSREEVMKQLKALGYIDPGAGSSMWQVILAGFFRISGRLKSVFSIFRRRDSEEEDDYL